MNCNKTRMNCLKMAVSVHHNDPSKIISMADMFEKFVEGRISLLGGIEDSQPCTPDMKDWYGKRINDMEAMAISLKEKEDIIAQMQDSIIPPVVSFKYMQDFCTKRANKTTHGDFVLFVEQAFRDLEHQFYKTAQSKDNRL